MQEFATEWNSQKPNNIKVFQYIYIRIYLRFRHCDYSRESHDLLLSEWHWKYHDEQRWDPFREVRVFLGEEAEQNDEADIVRI